MRKDGIVWSSPLRDGFGLRWHPVAAGCRFACVAWAALPLGLLTHEYV